MPTPLLLAIHNHQPDGNFGHVFEQAYNDCYAPLLAALDSAPRVRFALHHTGALLEWIERERPVYFERLRGMVARGQVELLGGGFYEPMLAVLPERDARGQIEMMSRYLESRFGVVPEGMWLAERVWEPALAKLIADAGIKYTLVDDGHFRAAGLDGTLRGYYVTEKAGTPLALFPIEKKLREAIPFLKAWETMDSIARLAAEAPGALTYGDDGEKFGLWPHTKEWVWPSAAGPGWLADFLARLATADDIVTTTFSDYLRTHRPTGRVYLPTASYEEMGEWTLPASTQSTYAAVRQSLADRKELERARPFLHGGIWQAFLAKYPEANFMHKKMVLVSDKLARAQVAPGADSAALDGARQALYRAQCNCSYWHGLFGGLYLNYLRDTVYRNLIDAEVQADRVLGTTDGALQADLDADLQPEIALTNAELALYLKPDRGGSAYELDYRPRRFNLLNILGRRAEGYHGRLLAAVARAATPSDGPVSIHDLTAVKSAGLEDLLVYDRFPRGLFVDHFLAPGVTLAELHDGRYDERGDFCDAVYDVVELAAGRVQLRRRGRVAGVDVELDKTVTVAGARIDCRYQLRAAADLDVLFAPELALTLLAGDAPDRYYRIPFQTIADRRLASSGAVEPGTPLELVDEWDQFYVRVTAAPAAPLWRYPLETASQSEGGFERTYQASVLHPLWHFSGALDATVTVEVRPIDA